LSISVASRPAVGVSTHEAVLTNAVFDGLMDVRESVCSEVVVVLDEVPLGLGRPDLLLLSVDVDVLALRRAAGLRLRNLTEARVLGAVLSDARGLTAISHGHLRRVEKRLVDAGWFNGTLSTGILDSLLIEAKVTHWGQGIEQLARVRWAAHGAALLVPDAVAANVSRNMLRFNQLGLLTWDRGSIRWRRKSPLRVLPPQIDAWLCELAIRRLEV
jgi:hypothetical protein